MKLLPLFQELLAAFFMVRVRDTAIYRAYFSALGCFKPADAFSALVSVNDVDCLSFLDGFILAFRLAGTATNAFIGDCVRHFLS